MGVDYQARKAAKKGRKGQRGEELKPRRERKKKQARRLCRGALEKARAQRSGPRWSPPVAVAGHRSGAARCRPLPPFPLQCLLSAGACYQEPGLKPEDLEEEQGSGSRARAYAGGGELARFAHMDFGGDAEKKARRAADAKGGQKGDKPEPKAQAGGKRKQQQQQQEQQQQRDGGSGGAAAAKKPRLSTAVNLLDAKTARTEAPRVRAPPGAGVSDELRQYPDLLQRFMAGEGFAEPMPIQSRRGGTGQPVGCWLVAACK